MKKYIIATLILFSVLTVYPQTGETGNWIKLLESDGSKQAFNAATAHDSIAKHDSGRIKEIVTALEKQTSKSGLRIQARVQALKARLLFYKLDAGDSLYAAEMKTALEKAYRLNDMLMIAEFSRWYGEMLNSLGDVAAAAQYCMNSLKLQQEAGFQNFPDVKTFYLTTAEMLFKTVNYKEAIKYYLQALKLTDENTNKDFVANSINTVGRCYYLIQNYDSSVYWYQRCMDYAKANSPAVREDWYYAASDNRYEPWLELRIYDSCQKIADELYQAGLPADSAMLMGASFMYARIAIRNNRYEEGLKWGLQSEKYGRNAGNQLVMVYADIAQCYEKLGQNGKALPYYKLYRRIIDQKDSISKMASAAFLNAESEFQKNQLRYKQLQQENNRQIGWRNGVIVGGILISILIIASLLRRKRKTEKEKLEAEIKSKYFEHQFNNAEEQLAAFKNKITEYSQKLDSLQEAFNKKEEHKDNAEKIEELSRLIILTEKDWDNFKETFGSVYPGFFTKLKNDFPDITNAELRMCALIKLNFSIKHAASMLGISQDSVHKTRYRLRKRFGDNSASSSIEELIAGM
jgi:DNA-binding CsgD family transcriptional regulator